MENRVTTAISFFNQGVNCAQALLTAYGIKLGVNRRIALKIASGFGGGMARMGKTCGAVSGAFMVIGLKHGMTKPGDKKAKEKTYELCGKFVKKFKSRHRSIVCRELLGFDLSSEKSSPDLNKIIQDKCPGYVKTAAEIIEEIL